MSAGLHPPLWSTFPSYRPGLAELPDEHLRYTPLRPLTYILFGPSGRASRKGGGVAVATAVPVPERRRRVKMVAWSSAWLIVLAEPAHDIARGLDRPVALAASLMAAFVVLYLALLWIASDPTQGVGVKLALLAPLGAIAVGATLAYHRGWEFLFFFVAAAAACALPERRAVFGVVAVSVVDAVVVTQQTPADHHAGPQIFGVFMAGLVVMFMIRLMRLVSDLNAAREDLARLAVADERLRFARDLHDLLGHTLSLIVVKSEAVRRLVGHDTEAAARESGDIEMVSRQALAEVREAVTNYRERSLEAELEGARLALSAAGIEATIHRPAQRLPDPVESVLGWTVREGVTNVVRHSHGRHCDIDLRHADGNAVLEIRDDGVGEAAPVGGSRIAGVTRERGGSGLRGLAERLAAFNGRLEAGRQPGGGFRLAVTVPLNATGRGPG